MSVRARVKSSEDVWIPGTITVVSLCSVGVRLRTTARLLRVVTVCSARFFKNLRKQASRWRRRPEHPRRSPRQGQSPSAEPSGRRHPLPCVRKEAGPGKALSRCVGGRVDSKGAGAGLFSREKRGTDTASSSSQSAAISAPTRPDSDTQPPRTS